MYASCFSFPDDANCLPMSLVENPPKKIADQRSKAYAHRDPMTLLWSRKQFAKRTREIYQLCEEWFSGIIDLDEFYAHECEILRVPSTTAVTCMAGQDLPGEIEVENLTNEFARVSSVATAIMWANIAMQEDGLGDDATPLVKAIYFAREWADVCEGMDDMTAELVYSV